MTASPLEKNAFTCSTSVNGLILLLVEDAEHTEIYLSDVRQSITYVLDPMGSPLTCQTVLMALPSKLFIVIN